MTAVAGQLFDVVVLGAGPAGAAAAAGLARLGHSVTLVSRTRAPSVEGLSMRALDGLDRSGPGARGRQRLRAGSAARLLGRATIWNSRPGMSLEAGRIRRFGWFPTCGRWGHSDRFDCTKTLKSPTMSGRSKQPAGWFAAGCPGCARPSCPAQRPPGPLLVAWNTTYQTSRTLRARGVRLRHWTRGWCWIAEPRTRLLSLHLWARPANNSRAKLRGFRPRSVRCLRLARF